MTYITIYHEISRNVTEPHQTHKDLSMATSYPQRDRVMFSSIKKHVFSPSKTKDTGCFPVCSEPFRAHVYCKIFDIINVCKCDIYIYTLYLIWYIYKNKRMHLPTPMFNPVKTNPKVQQCRGPIMETPAGAPAGELLGACWQRHRTPWNGSLWGRLQFTNWLYLVLFPVFPIYRILFGYI
jgi:hypothetical protein